MWLQSVAILVVDHEVTKPRMLFRSGIHEDLRRMDSHPLIHKQGGKIEKEKKGPGIRKKLVKGRDRNRESGTVESRDPKGLGEYNRKVAVAQWEV